MRIKTKAYGKTGSIGEGVGSVCLTASNEAESRALINVSKELTGCYPFWSQLMWAIVSGQLSATDRKQLDRMAAKTESKYREFILGANDEEENGKEGRQKRSLKKGFTDRTVSSVKK